MIKNLDNIIATAKKTAVAKKIAEPILNSNLTKPTLQETKSTQIPAMRFKKAVVQPTSPIKFAPTQIKEPIEQSAISKVAPVSVDPFSATDIKPFVVEPVKKQEAGDVGKFVKDVAKTNWAQVGDEIALEAKTKINSLKSLILNPMQDVSMTEKNRNLVTAIAGKDVSNRLAREGVAKNIKSEANKQATFEENMQDRQAVAQKYAGQDQSEFGKIVSGVGSGIVQMAPMMISNLIVPNSGLMVMFADVGESEYRQALSEGATPEQANLYGLLKAGVEVGTEMAFGGIPLMGEGLADKTGFKKWVSSGIGGVVEDSLKTVAQSEAGKAFMSKAIDVLGEGAEEYVSEVLGNAIVGVYKKPDKTLWESATSKEAWDAWLIGSLTSATMNLGQYGAGKTLQTVALENKVSNISAEENQEIAKALAEKMDADLIMVDAQDNRNGSFIPAKDGARAQIYISENSRRPIATVALHETAHALINQTKNGEEVVKDFLSIYYDGAELTEKFAKTKAKYQNFYDQSLIMEKNNLSKEQVDALSDAEYVQLLNETVAQNPKDRRIANTDEMLEEVFAETLEGVIDSAEGMRRLVTGKPKIADKIRSQIAKLGAQLSGDDNFLLVKQMESIFNEYMQGYESYKQITKAQNVEQAKTQIQPQTELGRLLATVKQPTKKPVMASLEAKTEKPVVDTTKSKQAPKSPEMAYTKSDKPKYSIADFKSKERIAIPKVTAKIFTDEIKEQINARNEALTKLITENDAVLIKNADSHYIISKSLKGSKYQRTTFIKGEAWSDAQYDSVKELLRDIGYKSNVVSVIKTEADKEQFSVKEEDSKGRKLTTAQKEYFKDSKVVDEEGKLIPVYHGSRANDFNVFDVELSKGKRHKYGVGVYFTEDAEYAKSFKDDSKGNLHESYLNLKNPLDVSGEGKNFFSKNQIKKIIDSIPDSEIQSKIDMVKDGWDILNAKLDKANDISEARNMLVESAYKWENALSGNLGSYLAIESLYDNNKEFFEAMQSVGYDGLTNGRGIYVAFDSSQIKNVNNLKPTESKDIRYSLADFDLPSMRKKYGIEKLSDEEINDIQKKTEANAKSGRYNDLVEMVDVDVLNKFKEYDRLNKPFMNNEEQFKKLTESIKKDGIKEYLYVSFNPNTGFVKLGEGNHRLGIANLLGLKQVPVLAIRSKYLEQNGNEGFYVDPDKIKAEEIDGDKYYKSEMKPSELSEIFKAKEKFMLTDEQVARTNVKFEMKKEDIDLLSDIAKRNPEKVKVTEDGIQLEVIRHQKALQDGELSNRNGVFYLSTTAKEKFGVYKVKSDEKAKYGGAQEFKGTITVKKPLIIQGQTGGRIPLLAIADYFDKNKGSTYSYLALISDIFSIQDSMIDDDTTIPNNLVKYVFNNTTDMSENQINAYIESLENVYGEVDAKTGKKTYDSGYVFFAIREFIASELAKKQGYDSIIGVDTRLSPEQQKTIWMEYYKLERQVGKLAEVAKERMGKNFNETDLGEVTKLMNDRGKQIYKKDGFVNEKDVIYNRLASIRQNLHKMEMLRKEHLNPDSVLTEIIDLREITYPSKTKESLVDPRFLDFVKEKVDGQRETRIDELKQAGFDVKFSVKDGKRDLIALHNLNEDNLMGLLELGGIPVPSIAIIKEDMEHENFGDVTVVMKPEVVNPKKTPVFSADAYTARFPKIITRSVAKEVKELKDKFYAIRDEAIKNGTYDAKDDKFRDDLKNLFIELEAGTVRDKYGLLERLATKSYMQDYYEKETGKKLDTRAYKSKNVLDIIGDRLAVADFLFEKIKPAMGGKYIQLNVDRFDKNNNEKPFSKTHIPYTLENVAKVMKGNQQGVEAVHGVGVLNALLSRKFDSKKDLKNSKERLVTEFEFNEKARETTREYDEIIIGLAQRNTGYFRDADDASIWINDYVKSVGKNNITEDSFIKFMKEQDYNVEPEFAKVILDYFKKLQQLPTKYFEAKPQRAVKFSEVETILIPESADPKLIEKLDEMGIHYIKYDYDGRKSIIRELDNAKFSLDDNIKFRESADVQVPSEELAKSKLLTRSEQNELADLISLDDSIGIFETDEMFKRYNELVLKAQGKTKEKVQVKQQIKDDGIQRKFGDLVMPKTYKDVYAYKNFKKYKEDDNYDRKVMKDALSLVKGYQGGNKRTLAQWLMVANQIGANLKVTDSEALKKYAIQTWYSNNPNQKDNLNRQGKKYVPFAISDWVKAVYEGAGVGKSLQASETKQVKAEIPTEVKQAPEALETPVKQPESIVDMMALLVEEDALLENPDEDMGTDEPILEEDLIQPAEEILQEVKNEIKEEKKKDTTPKEVKALRTPTVAKKISRVTPKTNIRKHEQTIASTDVISDNQKSRIDRDIEAGKFTYDVYSDSKSLGYADSVLSLGMDQAYNNFIAKVAGGEARITKGDIAIAERLIQEYSHMQGQWKKVQELIQYLSIAGTELGQAVQAMSLIKKIGTYGQMMALQKIVDRMERQYLVANNKKGNIAQQKMIKQAIAKAEAEGADPEVIKKLNEKLNLRTLGIVIDENLKQKLLETNPEDTKAVQLAVDAIKANIASQIPATVTDKLNAWRYLSMLGNPKTHVRNIIGNATFATVGRTKDLVATVLEKKLPVEQRTKAILNKKADKVVLDYAKESYAEMADLMDVGSKYDMQNEIERMKTIFKNKWLEKARLKNFEFLEKEDAIFKKSAYINAMAQWIKAKGLNPKEMSKEQIQQAKNHAVNEALKMTFQDASEFASALNQFEKRTGTAGKILMGGIIPFKKTPINILKRGVEYSPLGLATLVPAQFMEYRKGNITQAELIDSVSAGLTGTGIALVGAMLASMGFLNIDDDEDKKKNQYDEMLGKQNYSINVGGKSFTIDWAVPSAMPLFIGAHIWKQMNENGANLFDPNVLPTAMAGIFNPAFEMSMLQGLTNALKSYNQTEAGFIGDVITNVGESYAGQFVPTVSGQLAKIIDQTRRSTYAPKDSPINPVLETFLRRMANKVPLASFMNPAMVNAQGVELKQDDNIIMRALNNLLNPAYVESSKITDQDKEIIKLFEDTKNTELLPRTASKSFTFNKKTYVLNSDEYAKFAKTMGTTSYESLKKLIDNPTYQILTADEKTEAVKSLYEYARSKAQAEYLAGKKVAITNKEYLAIKQGEAHGVSAVDYVIAKNTYQNLGDIVISKKSAFITQLVNRGYNYEKIVYLVEQIGDTELKESDITFIKNRLKARK